MAVDVDRPILLFDSGVGGLSVLTAVRHRLPDAPLLYLADNGGFPYGTKTEAAIAARVPALLGRVVERYRPRLLVIACNTASTIALGAVREALDLPVVGTVPAIKPAAERSHSRVIGVLGTDATVRQPYLDDLVGRFAADCVVLRHGSAALVELAEQSLRGRPTPDRLYANALAGLLDQPGGERLDTVVLACTHFPLVADRLAAVAPRPLAFVHGAEGIARRAAWLTRDERWPAVPPPGVALFTAADDGIAPLEPALARHGLSTVQLL